MKVQMFIIERIQRMHDRAQAGDVPAWVMLTLMSAGLVILLWALAGDALTRLFNSAIERVLGGI